ncbi:potassium-transporting ATPase subunit F [Myceligenerans pegani]|uniref:Potassium-transporting ATPase subunit F n=1 Tax=Myceligenerans pegani TaxID=2776917 RepID=A0ABR9MY07_9MICO|nr:potassium-transporting ATPase subunit F [Myceligenerans sp. TRM 65318]MBE1875677.1 potassium-transporting ATPase subunit F [Myceligenerans sp. TRM 65318]MBE3017948.1 potassium-transporting ATPase subunit F [Myceligenerans sp. TRM 65318]
MNALDGVGIVLTLAGLAYLFVALLRSDRTR